MEEALKREIELLKQIIAVKDELISELRLKTNPSLVNQWIPPQTISSVWKYDSGPTC